MLLTRGIRKRTLEVLTFNCILAFGSDYLFSKANNNGRHEEWGLQWIPDAELSIVKTLCSLILMAKECGRFYYLHLKDEETESFTIYESSERLGQY